MAARDPKPFAEFDEIPDPARGLDTRPTPAAPPAERSPTRGERRRHNKLALAIALVWIALLLWPLGPRADLGALHVAGTLALWLALAILSLLLVLSPRARGLPLGVRALSLTLALIPLGFVLSVLVSSGTDADLPLSWKNTGRCFQYTSLLALGPLLVAAWSYKRSFTNLPALRGAAIGAVCGLSGAIAMQAHCPCEASSHILVAHGLPILLGALAGGLFGALRGRA